MSNRSHRRIEVKSPAKGQLFRLTINEWHKTTQLGKSYWLYTIWDPLENPDAKPSCIQNRVKRFDHIKGELVAVRYYDIPTEAISCIGATGGVN